MKTTTYSDGRGREHTAVFLTWDEVTDILGHEHEGSPADDEALVTHLRSEGAPAWVEDAEGWVEEGGWGLIGPALDMTPKEYRRLRLRLGTQERAGGLLDVAGNTVARRERGELPIDREASLAMRHVAECRG